MSGKCRLLLSNFVVQDDIIGQHVREIWLSGKDVQFDNENEKNNKFFDSMWRADHSWRQQETFQRQYIESILRKFNGNVEKAAARQQELNGRASTKKIDKLGMNSKAF